MFYLDRENVPHVAVLVGGQYEYKKFKNIEKPVNLRNRIELFLTEKFGGIMEGQPLYLIPINSDELG